MTISRRPPRRGSTSERLLAGSGNGVRHFGKRGPSTGAYPGRCHTVPLLPAARRRRSTWSAHLVAATAEITCLPGNSCRSFSGRWSHESAPRLPHGMKHVSQDPPAPGEHPLPVVALSAALAARTRRGSHLTFCDRQAVSRWRMPRGVQRRDGPGDAELREVAGTVTGINTSAPARRTTQPGAYCGGQPRQGGHNTFPATTGRQPGCRRFPVRPPVPRRAGARRARTDHAGSGAAGGRRCCRRPQAG